MLKSYKWYEHFNIDMQLMTYDVCSVQTEFVNFI